MEKLYRRRICRNCNKKCNKIKLIKIVTGRITEDYSQVTTYTCEEHYKINQINVIA